VRAVEGARKGKNWWPGDPMTEETIIQKRVAKERKVATGREEGYKNLSGKGVATHMRSLTKRMEKRKMRDENPYALRVSLNKGANKNHSEQP